MQSISIDILEKERSDREQNLLIIWRESDTQKAKAVQALAQTMETIYITNHQEDLIKTICRDIKRFIIESGGKNAHHVHDYLHEKYKREWSKDEEKEKSLQPSKAYVGLIDANNLLEIMLKDPLHEATREDVQNLDEYAKIVAIYAKANRQAAVIRGIPVNDYDPLANRKDDKIKTEMPEPRETVAWDVWENEVTPVINTLNKTHIEIGKKLKALPPDDEMAHAMVEPLREYAAFLVKVFGPINEFLAPLKDLKFATTKPRWWSIVLKYFEHGKHAAAVMQAINSHRFLEERDIKVQKINCPCCEYFATVPDIVDTPMHPQARAQLYLLRDHVMDHHDKGARHSVIMVEVGKVTVQVPKERDLTREQVGDKIKELVELAINFVAAIKALKALSDWREKYADGRVATRRIAAHDKLSELA